MQGVGDKLLKRIIVRTEKVRRARGKRTEKGDIREKGNIEQLKELF